MYQFNHMRFLVKTIKGLNTDRLDSTDLETISTDYYYSPNTNNV